MILSLFAVTVLLKPFTGVVVMVELPVLPCATLSEAGEAAIWKSGTLGSRLPSRMTPTCEVIIARRFVSVSGSMAQFRGVTSAIGARDGEVGGEVAEAPHAEEGVTDDQQLPPLPHDLQRPGERAVLARVVLRQCHARMLAHFPARWFID